MITINLFGKPDCGLCDEVKAELASLQATFPHQLNQIDITQDSELFDRYRYIIPVVQIGEIELLAPITAVQLQEALHTYTKQTPQSP